MYSRVIVFVFVGVLSVIVVQGAPQGQSLDTFTEVFKQCSDLENDGYEGYKCTAINSCQDGFIVSNPINDLFVVKQAASGVNEQELDVSNYECPEVAHNAAPRQDADEYDEYGDYGDEYYTNSESKLICCRDPKFFGKGPVTETLPGPVTEISKGSCEGWQQDGFECVSKNACEEDGHFNTFTGQVATGIRTSHVGVLHKIETAREAKCNKPWETCCRKDSFYNIPFNQPKANLVTKLPVQSNPGRKDVDTEFSINTRKDTRRCGTRNEDTSIRIAVVDGSSRPVSAFAEWPHMCIILRRVFRDGINQEYYTCGASLISPGIVLTAAHCVATLRPEDTVVRCGEYNSENLNERKPHQNREAKHISVHPAFNSKTLYYDYALVHTSTDFEYDEHIFPICLPDPFEELPAFTDDEPCYVMGYGQDRYGEGANFSPIIKMAEMYTIDFEQCQIDYRDTERPNFHLHHSFNCFQGNGAGTCSGDGGSPLVCPIPNSDKYMQVGITSWGDNDCHGNKPDVFGDVSKALGFIDWASKCVEGMGTDFFGLQGYERWAKRQYCNNMNEIENIKTALLIKNNPHEKDFRRRWLQLNRQNKKFEEAISNCKNGPTDYDCKRIDYIRNLDDFKNRFDSDDERDDNEVGNDHDAWVRSDVESR